MTAAALRTSSLDFPSSPPRWGLSARCSRGSSFSHDVPRRLRCLRDTAVIREPAWQLCATRCRASRWSTSTLVKRRHRARGTPARVLLPETAVTKPTATQRLSTQGGVSVSGDVLVPLLHRVRLNGSEWRIVVAVLISSRPVSARELALGLRLDYGFVKRIVRGLVAWRILSATPEGLSFQPDATRWAAAPAGGRQR